MAESQSMTSAEVVAKALIEEHPDFLRESVAVSTRKVDHLVSELGIHMSKDQVSRICGERDGQVEAFRTRPLEGEYPYLWLDAKHLKVRDRGHVHSKALMVAFAVHESGRREVIGIEIAPSETEAGWAAFLRELRARGLEGVRLCASDDHLGLKAAIAKVLGCPWQRCTVHFIRNMHGHCTKGQRNMVSAALREVLNAEDLRDAKERSASVIERLAPTAPKVAALLEAAEEDLLAFYRFPQAHWPKLRSTNNIERVNKEIARRSDASASSPTTAR